MAGTVYTFCRVFSQLPNLNGTRVRVEPIRAAVPNSGGNASAASDAGGVR